MKIFAPITLQWWQVSILKSSLLSLGLIIGARFNAFVTQWENILILIFTVTTIYLLLIWLNENRM